jgi:glycosyltransferase involved in cell wall biosynthesis
MRILLVHNYYCQPGGEDEVYASEAALLEREGHLVGRFTVHNNTLAGRNLLQLGVDTVWSTTASNQLRRKIAEVRPDVIHFHNTFPQVSPAAYYVARRAGIPTVQTLHNYRLICPSAILYRGGSVCEDCVEKVVRWPGILGACYRESRMATGTTVAMLAAHRAAGTWHKKVSVYIALTEFARSKYIEGGLPRQRIVVKPNFMVADPRKGEGGSRFLFVGRLTEEKGIRTLLEAWRLLNGSLELDIVGDGPLAAEVAKGAEEIPGIHWLGRQPKDAVLARMRSSLCVIIPSLWYEAFPMIVVEAFATGLPVIASNHGSLRSLICHGRTGLHFEPGNSVTLAATVKWAANHPEEIGPMRGAARAEYEEHYTAQRNYELLMDIYKRALGTEIDRLDRGQKYQDASADNREPSTDCEKAVLG